jgi:hypothetical protein
VAAWSGSLVRGAAAIGWERAEYPRGIRVEDNEHGPWALSKHHDCHKSTGLTRAAASDKWLFIEDAEPAPLLGIVDVQQAETRQTFPTLREQCCNPTASRIRRPEARSNMAAKWPGRCRQKHHQPSLPQHPHPKRRRGTELCDGRSTAKRCHGPACAATVGRLPRGGTRMLQRDASGRSCDSSPHRHRRPDPSCTSRPAVPGPR